MNYTEMFQDAFRDAGRQLYNEMIGEKVVNIECDMDPYEYRGWIEIKVDGYGPRKETIRPDKIGSIPTSVQVYKNLKKDVQIRINELKKEYTGNGYKVNAQSPYDLEFEPSPF